MAIIEIRFGIGNEIYFNCDGSLITAKVEGVHIDCDEKSTSVIYKTSARRYRIDSYGSYPEPVNCNQEHAFASPEEYLEAATEQIKSQIKALRR